MHIPPISSSASPHNIFLAVGLVFGIIFVVIIPPFQAPDEWMHYRRAYHISEGNMLPDRYVAPGLAKDNITRENVGGMLPERVVIGGKFAFFGIPYDERHEQTVLDAHGMIEDPFKAGRKLHKENVLSLFRQPLTNQRSYLIFFPNTALHSPHLYIPQVAGIALGRIMAYPPIALMYMGRFFNLLAWLCLIYIAISIIPVQKWLLLLLALTPTSLFQASSLSADALTNGLSFLLIAVFLHYAYSGMTVTRSLIAALLPLSMLVALSKLYFFLIFLFLLIPPDRVGGRRKYWGIFLLLATFTAAAVIVWAYFIKNLYVPFKSGISPRDQLQFLLQHPGTYLSAIWNTLALHGKSYVMSFVGRLGHFQLSLPGWLIVAHTIVLFVVAAMDSSEGIVVGLKNKLLSGWLFLFGTVWTLTIQYLTGTVVGASVIEGVQGRYFIPIAPLLLLLLYQRTSRPKSYTRIIPAAVACYVVALLVFTSHVILNGYYL